MGLGSRDRDPSAHHVRRARRREAMGLVSRDHRDHAPCDAEKNRRRAYEVSVPDQSDRNHHPLLIHFLGWETFPLGVCVCLLS